MTLLECFAITIVIWYVCKIGYNFLQLYQEAKEEVEDHIEEPTATSNMMIPPSMDKNGRVEFNARSEETLGTMDGKPIYKFLIDDHGYYWLYDGIYQPGEYIQPKHDPIPRIFIGKILYKCLYQVKKDK